MLQLMPVPLSVADAVTDILHGRPITDPYRWLEEQDSPRTRDWLAEQAIYARSRLDAISDRDRIRSRIHELVDVETYDSILTSGNRYVFRKRGRGQEQPSIFVREGVEGFDEVLIDPAQRSTGDHTAVKPLQLSPDGGLLLYEVKEGGERTGVFELFDIEKRELLPDALPRGYLRGFAFAPDMRSFYYVHEAARQADQRNRTVYQHNFGTALTDDREIFRAEGSDNLRVLLVAGATCLGFLVFKFGNKRQTDFYVWSMGQQARADLLVSHAEYTFAPVFQRDRILAITNRCTPSSRIVEVLRGSEEGARFVDIVAETDCPIRDWVVTSTRIYVLYVRGVESEICIFDHQGGNLGRLPADKSDTVRIIGAAEQNDELLIERESFAKPIQISRYSPRSGRLDILAQRALPFDPSRYCHTQVWFHAKDGTRVPMFLAGRRDVVEAGTYPAIMTSYGGYGVPMTPQFSVFVFFLMERGCLFALPNIRGGSEFGVEWHNAAKRRKRQVAIDDFISAAEWLIGSGRTTPQKLAIFGGSNSGLLVGAALTQRPELFRAVVCMVPMLDMLRYHLFDHADVWSDELGTAEDRDDFAALAAYSPYHHIREGTSYPATMFVAGDADRNCNPMHARKMTARMQSANISDNPIILDYSRFRGHSPVLPLTERIEALTDRMAFLVQQLGLRV